MLSNLDQSFEEFQRFVHIANLPTNVTAKQITDLFEQFGVTVRLFLRRRISINSPIFLPNPSVTLIFQRLESVDQLMAKRPYRMGDCELFVRRCLPITQRYPYETNHTTKQMLVCIPEENYDEILPNDELIADYLKAAGGQILHLERLDEQTVLVQFDDYDPVDVCCLSRPHYIRNQYIEIKKCVDEQQVRDRVQFRQKNRSSFLELPSTPTATDVITQSDDMISPTLALNIDEQTTQLRLEYQDVTQDLEGKHDRLLSSLKTELEQMTKERMRLQRLTLDYKQEQSRLNEENRRWQKLYSESLREKPRVQAEGERTLLDATEKYSQMK